MEFSEKVKTLRGKYNYTQEELAEKLFVSRVTVSKWESGRGYPNLDSLKLMAKVFSVSVDELLSGGQIMSLAENQLAETSEQYRTLVFGICDVLFVLFLLIPFYSTFYPGHVESVILSKLGNVHIYIRVAHYTSVLCTIGFGVAELVLQNWRNTRWMRLSVPLSFCLSITAVVLDIITRQLYASLFAFLLLLVKGFFRIKTR